MGGARGRGWCERPFVAPPAAPSVNGNELLELVRNPATTQISPVFLLLGSLVLLHRRDVFERYTESPLPR